MHILKPIVCINCGHGGFDLDYKYKTPPKQNKKFHHPGKVLHDGGWFYEGIGNRVIGHRLAGKFLNVGIPVFFLHDFIIDSRRTTRIKKANDLHRRSFKSSIILDLHSNAGKGIGYEIFTSRGQTDSDNLATKIFNETQRCFRDMRMRTDYTDGDPDKEKNFDLLAKTLAPAVTIEHEFFDTENGVDKLTNIHTIDKFNQCTFDGVINYFMEKGFHLNHINS